MGENLCDPVVERDFFQRTAHRKLCEEKKKALGFSKRKTTSSWNDTINKMSVQSFHGIVSRMWLLSLTQQEANNNLMEHGQTIWTATAQERSWARGESPDVIRNQSKAQENRSEVTLCTPYKG